MGRLLPSPKGKDTLPTPWVLLLRRKNVAFEGRNTPVSDAVHDDPVACNEPVIRIPVVELGVGDSSCVGLTEIDDPRRLPMQPDGVDPISVEITDERLVRRIAEDEAEIGRAQATIVGAELVDHIEGGVAGPIDADRVTLRRC